MRTADLAPPALTPATVPPGAPIARWPARLRIALEVLPQAAYVWDDADPTILWDDADPDRLVYDAPFVESGFTDAVCDFHTVLVDPGDADELALFPAVEATVTLANPDGRYTPWTTDGRLVYWAPGRRLHLYAELDDEEWWLFSGRVARWDLGADDTVTVVAYDGFAHLADELGPDWTPGTAGQTPLTRIRAIAAQAAYPDPIDGDPGDVALTTGPTDVTPLEACQVAALSDGGIFAGDADGRLLYRDRLWRAGRDDQGAVAVFSDNVCTVPAVVWDPELTAADDGLYTRVELVNAADVTVTATLPAGDPAAWYSGVTYRLTHPDPDLWPDAVVGQALADYLLAQQSTPAMSIRSFTLHLTDPKQDLWRTAIDLRRGDLVRFLHDYLDADGRPATLDVYLICSGVRHEITPEGWVATVATTRTVDWTTVELWDATRFVWDDPDPAAVWRY
jgi:hypothetical protein